MNGLLAERPFAGTLAARLAGPRSAGLSLYWLGQAGFVLDIGPLRLVIDPYLSDTLGLKYAGTPFPHERMMPAPVDVEGLGPVDLVLCTHHHGDHMDPGTLAPLARLHPELRFVVPAASLAQARERIGVGEDRLVLLDAGDEVEPLPGVSVRALRAAHEALETDGAGRHRFLGFGVTALGTTILHAGDTIPFEGQDGEIMALAPDLALLPVNGRSEALRRAGIAGNLFLDEAIALCETCAVPAMIAHHHGLFAFNTADVEAIDAAAADAAAADAATSAPITLCRARLGVEWALEPRADAAASPLDPRLPRVTTQNVLEVVRTMRPELRKSERKVADLVLAHASRILHATLAETAHLADVSQPTVVRFCVAVGCSGFQDFKLRLAHSLALGTPATHSVLLDTDAPEAVVEKIFDYTITSLDWARHHLDRGTLAKAIAVLEGAAAIEFFGFGASGIVARDAQQKFPLFGVPCGAQLNSHQQIMVAAMMRPGDVAVVISNTGRTRSLLEVARTARSNGATVIGITGSQSPLVEECDLTLVVETLDNTNIYTPTISRIAALVVIDVLSTAVALRRGEGHQHRFQEMKRRLNTIRFGDEEER